MEDSCHTLVPDNEFDLNDEESSVTSKVIDNEFSQKTDLSENGRISEMTDLSEIEIDRTEKTDLSENGITEKTDLSNIDRTEKSDLSENDSTEKSDLPVSENGRTENTDLSEIDRTEQTDLSENDRIFESNMENKCSEHSENTEKTDLCENDKLAETKLEIENKKCLENLDFCENERISESGFVVKHDKPVINSSLEMIDVCDMCQNKNRTELDDTNICDKNPQIMIYCDSDLINSSLKKLKLNSECDRGVSDITKPRNMLGYKIKTCQKCQIQFPQPVLEEEG